MMSSASIGISVEIIGHNRSSNIGLHGRGTSSVLLVGMIELVVTGQSSVSYFRTNLTDQAGRITSGSGKKRRRTTSTPTIVKGVTLTTPFTITMLLWL